MVTERLARRDWLNAAMMSLAKDGHQSLRVERLAKLLGVSRGSFYWHFADVETFERAVLDEWEVVAVDLPYSRATAINEANRSAALHNLLRAVFKTPVHLERAVRSWATTSPMAAKVVQRVDKRRLALLTGLVSASQSNPEEAHAAAVILYCAYLGHVSSAGSMVDDAVVAALIKWISGDRHSTTIVVDGVES